MKHSEFVKRVADIKLKGQEFTRELERYYETKNMASKPFILWQLDFARVFREKGGFDIVVGNPPYVGEKGNKEMFRPVAATTFGERFYLGKGVVGSISRQGFYTARW